VLHWRLERREGLACGERGPQAVICGGATVAAEDRGLLGERHRPGVKEIRLAKIGGRAGAIFESVGGRLEAGDAAKAKGFDM